MIESNGRSERAVALQGLVRLDTPLDDALRAVSKFPFDSHDELLTLTRSDIIRALKAYIDGALTAAELERWAEAVHGRDDIALNPQDAELLGQALLELSTPELYGRLTQTVAASWTRRLQATQ